MSASGSPLKARITEDMKSAMRAGDKERLGAIRLIQSAIKQIEVDTRKELDDNDVLAVLDKMAKQRRESIQAFEQAGRDDLASQEKLELELIQTYLPEPLSDDEIQQLIDETIDAVGAASIKDMGKVIGQLKPRLQGRADMGAVSAKIKARLSGGA
ncbi:MAG TPA: GatB/YqeY domain-containing protein [Gammaproteobacteria bacterium]|nr:GatB/YqeY domain-containing protein [Gammaproteobacteria bacterium]